jgi:hypothetical protein
MSDAGSNPQITDMDDVRATLEDAARGTGWRVASVERRRDGTHEYLSVMLRRLRDEQGTHVHADSLEEAARYITRLPR